MTTDEVVTYNGKQYKISDLPPEVQNLLKDENNNGIPDRFEPQINEAKVQQNQGKEPNQFAQANNISPLDIEGIRTSLIKKYLTTSTLILVVSMAVGILIFILVFFAGVLVG